MSVSVCVVLEMCLGNVPHETGMEGPKFRAAVSFLLGRVGVFAVAIGPWEVRGACPAEPVEEKPESLAQFLKVLLLFFFLLLLLVHFLKTKPSY